MATNNGGRRVSKRRRSNASDHEEVLREINVSARQVDSCVEFGMPGLICCSGCTQFADREGLLIDDQDHDALMSIALAQRATKHKHRDKQCLRLWNREEDSFTTNAHIRLYHIQREFIAKRGYNPDRLIIKVTSSVECHPQKI